MANEISVTSSIAINKGSIVDSFSASIQADLGFETAASGVRLTGPTAAGEQLTAITIASGGVCWFRNASTSATIEIGTQTLGTFFPLFKLLPGEFLVSRTAIVSTSIYVKASSASVPLVWATYSP